MSATDFAVLLADPETAWPVVALAAIIAASIAGTLRAITSHLHGPRVVYQWCEHDMDLVETLAGCHGPKDRDRALAAIAAERTHRARTSAAESTTEP